MTYDKHIRPQIFPLGFCQNITIRDGYDNDEFTDDEEFPEKGDKKSDSASNTTTRKATDSTGKTPVLDKFGNDITRAAEEGRLDPVVGRNAEI